MSPPRLHPARLEELAPDIGRPAYDRARVQAGVVHVGPGAFHRAHQASAFDAILAGGDLRWGVHAVSLGSGASLAALAPQEGLFGLQVLGSPDPPRILGAIVRVGGPAAEAIAAPTTRLVTLTLTEAGYADVDGRPSPIVETLARALTVRREARRPPLAVLCCDNLPANGARLRRRLLEARPDLAGWLDEAAAFPDTMVDRITPAATAEARDAFADRARLFDAAFTLTEASSDWVIADRFPGERPPLELAGARFVADVAPFEAAKLRLLNGAHTALACLGGLAGHAFVHEAWADPPLRAVVERLWDETQETIPPARGLDLADYRARLAARFAEPAIGHRLDQIAIDGSQKLPVRILTPLAERHARGIASPALILAAAAWIARAGGRAFDGRALPVRDVRAAELDALDPAAPPGARAAAALALPGLFPESLRRDPALAGDLVRALGALEPVARGASLSDLGGV